ncbi:hypothetical protein [Hymenobacter bucti]|uniref:DUF4178 domain-containing protein n=1 Tax=Hymenobacter bucti TaxID=1844114 RepID=A0ABW4QUT2_9BACT
MSSTPLAPPQTWVTCPKCTAQVPCCDPAGSQYFGCFKCRTYFAAKPTPGGETRIARDFKRELAPGPSLPLGATGTLGGYHCRLTGYQVRGEKNNRTAEWREYQLRPTEPIVGDDPIDFPLQLAEYQGHWLLIRRAPHHPDVVGPRSIQGKEWTSPTTGNTYRLWHRYEPIIRDAQGEFDWNILEDERLKIQEFTCPPYLLSSEKIPDRKPIWYLSEYLEPAQVATAFGLDVNTLPSREGIGAAQPNPHNMSPAWRLFGVAALLLVLLTGWLAVTRPSATTTETFTVPAAPAASNATASPPPAPTGDTLGRAAAPTAPAAPATTTPPAASAGYSQMLVSKTIVLTHPSAVDITFSALDLTNHWLEITASLVNEQTGRGYEVTRSLEYYAGVEDGESWSEGSRSVSAVISGLPPGRYHLNLYPSAEAGTGDTTLVLQVEQHSGFFSNFVLILVLMSAVPLWHWMRHGSFENSRWENSDFAPTSS